MSSSPLPSSPAVGGIGSVQTPSEGFAALHQFTLYESRTLMVIVGADKTGHSCRLLTFDRTSPYELRVSEDPLTYTRQAADSQATSLIAQSGSPMERTMQLAAILGFIRLPKVFMVCVLSREKVGSIGGRWIYTITDWKLKAIGHKSFDSKRPAAVSKYKSMIMDDIELNKDFYFSYFYDLTHTLQHNLLGWKKEEQELREKRKRDEATAAAATAAQKAATQKANISQQQPQQTASTLSQPTSVAFPPVPAEEELFDPMAFDPIANDIPQQRRRTHSTLAPPPQPTTSATTQDKKNAMQSVKEEDELQPSSLLDRPRSDSTSLAGAADAFAATDSSKKMPSLPPLPVAMDDEKKTSGEQAPSPTTSDMFFQGGYPTASNVTPTMPDPASNYHPCYAEKWLWNLHLAREFLHYIPHGSYWLVPLIHGFVQQHAVRIGRKDVLVTLIARRSRHFAGTRYIKRGVSSLGHVANEVESEQIIQDRYSFSEGTGAFSSLVMLRGSIPLYFAQENPKSFKPDIVVYNFDRDFVSTKAHFADCFKRYGSPVSVLSLIKKEEKYPQETRLGMAFNHAIQRVSAQFRMDEISAQLAAAPEPVGQSREQAVRDEMLRIQEKLAREGNTPFPGASPTSASSLPSTTTTPNAPTSSPPPSNSILSSLRYYSAEPVKSDEKSAPVSDRVCARNPPPYNHPSYDPHSILYCTYDFLGQRAKQANVLRDLKSLVSTLVDEISVFTWVARPAVIPQSNLLSANSTKLQVREQEGVETKRDEAVAAVVDDEDASVVSLQKGVLRVNCIDCLDRTNVGQFCIGKAALKIQLKQLGICVDDDNSANSSVVPPSPYTISSPTASSGSSSLLSEVYPELIAILQDMYTQHGDRIAHQYAGSGAMHKEILYGDENTGMETEVTIAELEGGKKKEKALPTNITQNALSAIKRYYSNNFSDADKQCAINVFLGNYIPNLITHKPPIWELDVYTNLMDSDQLYARDGERFRVPWVPQAIGAIARSGKTQKLSKRLAQAVGVGASKLTAEAVGDANSGLAIVPSNATTAAAAALAHNNRQRFMQYFSEQYNPTKVTSFDEELKRTFQAPVVVKSASGLIETLVPPSSNSGSISSVPSSTVSARESSMSTLSAPSASAASSSVSPSPPAMAASASPSLSSATSSSAASLPSIHESGWEEVSVSKSNQPSASSSPVLAPKGAAAAAIPPLEKRKTNPLKKGFTSLFSSAKASFNAVLKSDQAVQRQQQQQQVSPPVAVPAAVPANNPVSVVVTPAKRDTVAAPAVTPAKPKAAIPVAAIVSQPPEVPPPAGTVGVTSLSSLMHQTQSQASNGLAPSSLSRESSSQFSPTSSSAAHSGDMAYPSQFLAASTSSAMYTGWSPRVTEKKTTPFRVPRLSTTTLSLDGDLPSMGLLVGDSAPGSAAGAAAVPAPIAPTSLELDRLAIHPDYLHSAAQDQYALERYAEYCDTNRLFDAQPLNFTVPFSQFETVAAAEAQTLGVRVLAAQAARHANAVDETSSLSEAALLTNSVKMSHHQLVDLLVSNLHDIESLQSDLFAAVEKQQLNHLTPKEYKAAAPVLIAPQPPAADAATRKQQNDAELRAFLEKQSS